MTRFFVLRGLALMVVSLGAALPAWSQTEERERASRYNAIVDNLDVLVENYTRFLARKYDLTDEQNEYTKYLLRERAYDFFNQNEEEVRVLLDRLFDVRTGGEMSQEELIEWGQRVKPVYEEAKQLIVDGNDEWRQILTDEQKKIHDEDLELMYESFSTTEGQLEQIVSGQMTVDEFRTPQRSRRPKATERRQQTTPRASPALDRETPAVRDVRRDRSPVEGQPEPRILDDEKRVAERDIRERPRVTQPEGEARRPRVTTPRGRYPQPDQAAREAGRARSGSRLPKKTGAQGFEGQWDKYVREFIERYKLNDEQTQKAESVLQDCKAQANRYLLGRKSQMEQLDKQIEELKKSKDKDKNKAKRLSSLTDQRNKLREPINRIFEQQLKPRLERLPTRAQRQAAEAAAKKSASKPGSVKKEDKKSSEGPQE